MFTGNSLVLPNGHAATVDISRTLSISGRCHPLEAAVNLAGLLERALKPTLGASAVLSAPSA